MNIYKRYRLYILNKKCRQLRHDSFFLFQITEYQNELWITFNGNLVCPCSMLNMEPVDALTKMRELYIKRHETE